jgi:ribulose-phosphate 3-epimerase
MAKIVPGILTASEETYVEKLHKAEHLSDLIQIDLVDGKFSKNKTVGVDVIRKFPSNSMLEIQLMVVNPSSYIYPLGQLDYVTRIIFPFEIKENIKEVIYLIKKWGKQAGLSLNPDTPIDAAFAYFDDLDLLLLMTGKPGYSGQKLGENTYQRIKEAKTLDPNLALEIDIGVNFENARKLAVSGADFLVTSSALFNADDLYVAYEKLDKLALVKR